MASMNHATDTNGSTTRGAPRGPRTLFLVFFLSFLVRALLLFPVLKNDMPPQFDESFYFRRAVAFASVVEDLARFRAPQEKDRDTVYGKGLQPPFHPICLSLGMLLLGKTVAVARFMVVLISALTTALVFLLAGRLAGPKVGLLAASLHLVHPSFLAFSHYLWSETTFIFLLLLALLLALRIPELPPSRSRTGLSILTGAALGCLALTRAAALLTIFIVPAWVFFRSKTIRAKIGGSAMILLAMLVTMLPWELSLFRREGRLVPITTFTYRNLYKGDNIGRNLERPDDVDGLEGWGQETLKEYASARSISAERAARELALKAIAAHPAAFARNGIKTFLFLWTFDFFPLRHIVNAVYPPMSDAVVLVSLGVFAVGALVFYLLVLKGLLVRGARLEHRSLILALVLGGALPYAASYGNTRFNLPQIALLLPLAGFGLAHIRERSKAFPPIAALMILCSGALFFRSYPDHIHNKLRPSSFYARSVSLLDRASGTGTLFADTFTLRNADPLTVTIVNRDGSDYSFDPRISVTRRGFPSDPKRNGSRSGISLRSEKERIAFTVYARDPRGPLELSIRSIGLKRSVSIRPVSLEFWNASVPTGLQGIEIGWRGGR
jgi:4-amino-4-deoxy-L-arabinose transferase-like glycosyltransferase